MKSNVALVLLLAFGVPTALTADTHTISGIVSDAMCGRTHRTVDAAGCAGDCVKKGADYALVVNGDVFTVKADKAAKEKLAKRVGKVAVVRGDVEGMTITATRVSTPKKVHKH